MGPWNLGIGRFRVVAVLCLAAMALIFIVGVQAPNDYALPITVGFVVLALVVWLALERRRFEGPPTGDLIAAREAAIHRHTARAS
ncbi:hypothetical protein [Phycicoccus jejuensis]|uniref:hypothetical protein n=1 Tax=Phycicoccus jejuensis TaxID=367299 RepID=UPI00068F3596|nr:hypothetical protein [Phycicoccus jejuensis]